MAGQETQASSRIFISYRREDAIAHVNALFHPLRERFGQDRLFKDTDSIAPGQDFLKAIQSQLESCSVFLAVIGNKWLTVQKPKSNVRRLDDPTDYLRVEVATALKNEKVRVIPILVGQASMPAPEDLPTDLAELAHRNGFELRDSRWDSDVRLLIQAIERACGEPASAGPQPRPVPPPPEPPPLAPPGGGGSPSSHDSEEFDLLEVRRKRQITEHVKVARQAFEALEYEAVLEACEKAVWLDPQQGEARDLARRARRALDEQKIQGWLTQAQELLARKELADAELAAASELIDQALSLNATHEAAVKLRQEMLTLRKQRERQREVDRQVRAALVRAQASIDEEDFDAAIEHCDDALAVSGESAEALLLRSKAAAAKEDERRQRELKRRAQQVVKDARAEFAAGQQEAALARLEQFGPPHDLIARALEELRKELQSLTQAREQKEREARAQDLIAAARSSLAAERFGDAATKLHEAAGLGLMSPEIAALLREVEVAQSAAETREREIQARQALEGEEARRRREESERAAAEAEKARLEAAAEQKRLMDARRAAEAAQRQRELGTEKARVEDLLGRGELDAAEQTLQTAEKQFESPAELRPLHDRLDTLRRLARHDALARETVEQARRDFDGGDHEEALERLAQFAPPHDVVLQALQDLRAQLEDIQRHRSRAQDLIAAARNAIRQKQFAEALERLHEAKSLWPDAPELSELLRSVQASIDSAERLQLQIQQTLARPPKRFRQRDYNRSKALVDAALELDPQHSAALQLQVAIQRAWEEARLNPPKRDLRRVAMYLALTSIGIVIAVGLTVNPLLRPSPETRTSLSPPAPDGGPAAPDPNPTTTAPSTPVARPSGVTSTPVAPAPTNNSSSVPPLTAKGPDIDAIHDRFTDALARNDLDGALRTIGDAEPAARNDPVIGRDLQRLVEVARSSTTQAFGRAQRANAAKNAEADYRAGIAKRTEANDLDKKGDKLSAVRSLMAASELFARAAVAKPPSPPAGVQPDTGTSGPVVQNPVSPPVTPKPDYTPSQPVIESKPVEAGPPPLVRQPSPEPAASPTRIGPPISGPPRETRELDIAAIQSVLAEFADGYRRLNAAGIRQVYPSAPALNFTGVKSYEITLLQPDVTVQGDTARVTCIREVRIQHAAGKAQEARQRVTFTLQRGPAGWFILSVR